MIHTPHSAAAGFAAALALCFSGLSAAAAPVISEIMYRPGTAFPENTGLEFIELYNPDGAAADISGWAFTSGVSYTFPPGSVIPAGGYVVAAANPTLLQAAYAGLSAKGPWLAGTSLSNNGEKIALSKPGTAPGTWTKVDEVTYATEGDWGQRVRETVWNGWDWTSPANGGGKSLEVRNPALSNDNGQNWGASTATAGGTPGAVNSVNSANVPPVIHGVKHAPAVPGSADSVTISCEVNDEGAQVTATLFYRDASSTNPGAFQSMAMTSPGAGKFTAVLPPFFNTTTIEFYIASSDGAGTRTWPAPTSEGQNANCIYQVLDEPSSTTADTYHLMLTAADNQSWENLSDSSDRQYNMTLITQRGTETTIRYRASMRTRGNSSRSYQFRPLRIGLPDDSAWDGVTSFNLAPRSPHLQHLGMRLLQASGLAASNTIPVELRRNGVEDTTSSGSTPDYGMWVRVEPEGREYVQNHWPNADTGNLYTKRSPERYWRSSGWTVPANPNGLLDNWSKQNNSASNDWTDLTHFFSIVQSTAAPHFPGAPATDVSQSNGGRLTGTGAWARTALDADGLETLQTAADTNQWARFFAAMTILQDYETNVSNGVDDDYGIYFVPEASGQRRAQFVPHDLDTILGMGDTPRAYNSVGLFDMTEAGGDSYAFRTLLPLVGTNAFPGNADFRTAYFTQLRTLLGTVFNADTTASANPPFYQFVDAQLGGWAPPSVIASIKEFTRQRRLYLLDLISDGAVGGTTATAITPPAATATSTITSAHGALIISEVLASNIGAHLSGGLYRDVIELRNTGAASLDLGGKSLTDDPAVKTKFVFPTGTVIAAGQNLVLYADSDFAAAGLHTGFQLDQGGDAVYLYDSATAGQALLDSVVFGPQAADLSIGRTGAGLNTWALCTPTIGGVNVPVATLGSPGGLVINEWLANTDFRFGDDFVELYNPATQPAALGGMRVTDDFLSAPAKHVLPPLSFIAGGGFQVLKAKGGSATPGNPVEMPFSIDSTFGFLALSGSNGTMVDRVSIASLRRDVSAGRSPDGSTDLTTFSLPSPGISNAAPPAEIQALVDFLRISEVLYKPDGGNDYEFVELTNTGTVPLNLSGVRFTGGIDYTFPAPTQLLPGKFIVVARNPAALLSRFPLAGPVLAGGSYTGALDNSGETLTLTLPKPWDAAILSFAYKTSWEPLTFSSGHSLQVLDPATTAPRDWNERETWGVSGQPGGTPGSDGPPAITSSLAAGGIAGDAFSYNITATENPVLFTAGGLPQGLSVTGATGVISGTLTQEGVYPVTITAANSAGADSQTLVLTVTSSGPLDHFAWRFTPATTEASVPFPAWITARDAQGRTVTSFNGSAALTATAVTGGSGASTVMITEVTDEDEDQFELQNTGSEIMNTSGWFVAVGHSTGINAVNGVTWPLPASLAPGELLRVSEFNQAGRLPFGAGISWTTSTAKGWIMLLDATSTPRDFFAWGWTAAELATLSVTLNGKTITAAGQWTGNGAPLGTRVNGNDSWQRTGTKDNNTSGDWVFASNATSWSAGNAGLVLPWQSAGSIAVSPATAVFSGGTFTGFLTIATPATVVRVTATALSKSGLSTAFDVTAAAADTDGDRMPDAWEAANGLNAALNDAAADLDRDGMSNFQEYYAGTDPRSAKSKLVIASVAAPSAGQTRLTWTAAANRLYKIRYTPNFASWQDVPGMIFAPAAAGTQTALFTNPASGTTRGFYRLELLTPP